MVGTSNVFMAMEFDLVPIGTHAHEWFMFHAAMYGFHQANKDLWNLEFEEYQRGPKKGEPKIIKKLEQVVPVVKNLRRDVENSTDFLYNDF